MAEEEADDEKPEVDNDPPHRNHDLVDSVHSRVLCFISNDAVS